MIFHRTRPYRGQNQLELQRHTQWKAIASTHLLNHPTCAACGSRHNLHVHHITPLFIDDTRELDPTNLVTLCTSYDYGVNCHLFFGHLGDWSRANPMVLTHAHTWLPLLTLRLKLVPPHPLISQLTVDPSPLSSGTTSNP